MCYSVGDVSSSKSRSSLNGSIRNSLRFLVRKLKNVQKLSEKGHKICFGLSIQNRPLNFYRQWLFCLPYLELVFEYMKFRIPIRYTYKTEFWTTTSKSEFRTIYNQWQNKKIKQNWTRPENFDICFYVSFYCYCQKLNYGGETGH